MSIAFTPGELVVHLKLSMEICMKGWSSI